MLTGAEKGYLAMTLFFLATGSGLKAYRHASVEIGPASDSLSSAPDFPAPESPAPNRTLFGDSSPKEGPPVDRADSSPAIPADDTASSVPLPGAAGVSAREPAEPGSQSGKSPASGRKKELTGKVSINRAEAADLMAVRGLGEKTAKAIIAYRRTHGPYRRLRDLLQVKGIGEKKLEKLIPYLIL